MRTEEARGRDSAHRLSFTVGIFPPAPMIDLTPRDVREFQDIVYKETRQRLSPEQAREQATSLIELVAFVLRVKPKR